MKYLVLTFLSCIVLSCTQQPLGNGYTIRDLKGGKWEDDNTYIYGLPFEAGEKHFLAQAYDSKFSHKGELSLDFKMKVGSKICASREGLVVSIKEDSDEGGLGDKYLSKGNFVLIQHDDNTYGGYWHLDKDGALVNEGDQVEKGQLIALSGNTGYSAFPHLHFWVYKVVDGEKKTVPTRFQTSSGIKYLKPGRSYTRPVKD